MEQLNKMNRYMPTLVFLTVCLMFCVSNCAYGQQKPEMIPYRLIPNDYYPDDQLELEIELIFPYTVENMVQIHREETLEIIYERINFETVNPNQSNQIFCIDQRSYYLIRIPYTGTIWNERETK